MLGLYSNIAISWMAAVVADLVINKPLGLSPPGLGSSAATSTTSTRWASAQWELASLLSIAAFVGLLWAALQPYASFVALGPPSWLRR